MNFALERIAHVYNTIDHISHWAAIVLAVVTFLMGVQLLITVFNFLGLPIQYALEICKTLSEAVNNIVKLIVSAWKCSEKFILLIVKKDDKYDKDHTFETIISPTLTENYDRAMDYSQLAQAKSATKQSNEAFILENISSTLEQNYQDTLRAIEESKSLPAAPLALPAISRPLPAALPVKAAKELEKALLVPSQKRVTICKHIEKALSYDTMTNHPCKGKLLALLNGKPKPTGKVMKECIKEMLLDTIQ